MGRQRHLTFEVESLIIPHFVLQPAGAGALAAIVTSIAS
jgi:hypothetical protein